MWSLWPVVTGIKSTLPIGHEDILLTWIVNDNIGKVPDNLSELFNGNIFYPYKNTKAYSDLFLPSSLLSYLPAKITGSYFAGFNFSLILGQMLTVLVVYCWFLEITKDKYSALLGSTTFGLSQIRMHYFVHIHTFILQWFMLATYFIWKFRKTTKVRYLYFAGALVVVQFWESPLPVFWTFGVAAILLFRGFNELKRLWRHVIVIGFMILLMTLPLINVYYGVSKEFNYQRSIRDAAHFSMGVNDLWGTYLSPGLYLLSAISIAFLVRKRIRIASTRGGLAELKWVFAVIFLGLLMALGPVLKIYGSTFKIFDKIFIPMPYGIFYYLIPGFGALRTPSRWMILFALGLSLVIAIAFSRLKTKFRNIVFLVALAIAIFGGARVSEAQKMPTREEYPKVYLWLKDQPGKVVLELPIYTAGTDNKYVKEMYRMLYSLEHKKTLVNGYSGFYPPKWQEQAKKLIFEFPSESLENELKNMGVAMIIVHKTEINPEKFEEIKLWGINKVVYEDDDALVYNLLI